MRKAFVLSLVFLLVFLSLPCKTGLAVEIENDAVCQENAGLKAEAEVSVENDKGESEENKGADLGIINDRTKVEPSRGFDARSAVVRVLLSTALKYTGVPYRHGGSSSRGFDCSGFVRFVFGRVGIELPHHSGAQAKMGRKVESSDLQPGDLVFFKMHNSSRINHVGIYMGENKFVHASINHGITVTSLNSKTYARAYCGATRIIE